MLRQNWHSGFLNERFSNVTIKISAYHNFFIFVSKGLDSDSKHRSKRYRCLHAMFQRDTLDRAVETLEQKGICVDVG
jgi:hypothetical protein